MPLNCPLIMLGILQAIDANEEQEASSSHAKNPSQASLVSSSSGTYCLMLCIAIACTALVLACNTKQKRNAQSSTLWLVPHTCPIQLH